MNTERQETALAKYHLFVAEHEFKNSYEYTPQPYPIDVLIDSACQAMDVPRHLFAIKTRKREIVYARRLVSVYLRINTNKTLESIAEITGNRDHACINHDRLWHNQCVDVKDPFWMRCEMYFLDSLKKFSINYSTNMRFPKDEILN